MAIDSTQNMEVLKLVKLVSKRRRKRPWPRGGLEDDCVIKEMICKYVGVRYTEKNGLIITGRYCYFCGAEKDGKTAKEPGEYDTGHLRRSLNRIFFRKPQERGES